MSDLKAQFEEAVANSKSLSQKPDNNTLLKIYSLYKQSTAGDVQGSRPGFTDFVGRAKFDAWSKLKGTPQDEAMQQYVDVINRLQGKEGRGFG
jgi:acyl-CoA-binding protein